MFTLVLVTASTMSMAIRERFRELAMLKALGFRRRELFAFILAESFGLAVTGAHHRRWAGRIVRLYVSATSAK